MSVKKSNSPKGAPVSINSGVNTAKPAKAKKGKEKELIPLDETVLFLAGELYKKISVIDLEVKEHFNRKTLIFSESELNSSLNISLKLSEFKEVKNLEFKLLDNDEMEMTIDIEKYSSSARVKRTAKIINGIINAEEACFSFAIDQENNRVEEIVCKILLLISKYILKHIFTQDFVKNFHTDRTICENHIFRDDLKGGTLTHLYHKNINQLFNTKVPFFGDKKIPDLIEIEGIMCEKGQLWVHYVYKIV